LRGAFVCALLLVGCASQPTAPAAPAWDAIPAGVAEALCTRLQMDAIATGNVTIIRVTQPLATPETIAAVAGVSNARNLDVYALIVNRALPILLARGTCNWTPIDVRDVERHGDEMVVALSAPLPNPFAPGQAGLFARVSLAREHESWYWIPLIPAANGGWSPGFIHVLHL
jgi:hypothetical protein